MLTQVIIVESNSHLGVETKANEALAKINRQGGINVKDIKYQVSTVNNHLKHFIMIIYTAL